MKDVNALIAKIQAKKGISPIAEMTAYDYPTARLVDEAGYDIILVGDSLGMVIMGYPDTTHVTLADMLHHVSMVARAAQNALIVGDMPINTYNTPDQALETARALIAAGADVVKLEGGTSHEAEIRAIVDAGIQVQAHIGLLPQSIKEEGGYSMKGKTEEGAAALMADLEAVVRAGAFSVVIECTRYRVAHALTKASTIPTIGIGSGHNTCDGEVNVYHDLVGAFPWFLPSFVTPKANIAHDVKRALSEWRDELRVHERDL